MRSWRSSPSRRSWTACAWMPRTRFVPPTSIRSNRRRASIPRPAWFEAYGCMRGDEVDQEAMRRTFDLIWKQVGEGHRWLFWGCDFPMLAMTAARLGKTKEALDVAAFGASQQRRSGQRFQSGRLDALSAGNRRPALGHGPDGRRLGGRPRQTRPRFPRRRELGGEVGRAEEGALRRNEQRAAHPHYALRSAAYAAHLALYI